jgi:CAAX protease family protein
MNEPQGPSHTGGEIDAPSAPGIVAQRPAPIIHSIFIGPDGLRPGWRFAVYVVSVICLLLLISGLTRLLVHRHPHHPPALWIFFVGEVESLIAALIPAVILARYEHRDFGDYGLPRREAFGKNFWWGVFWGIWAITLLLGVMRGFDAFYFGGLALHGPRILKFAAFWGVFFLIVGFFEEFIVRGYSQFTLAQGMSFWPAALLLSAIFGALHLGNRGEAWVGALAAAFIGLFWCFTLRRTGTLWFAVGMHAAWDWGESFLYSVPDSGTVAPGHLLSSSFHGPRWLTGGSVGPEGSVLVFVLIALMWLVFDRVFPARSTRNGSTSVVDTPAATEFPG